MMGAASIHNGRAKTPAPVKVLGLALAASLAWLLASASTPAVDKPPPGVRLDSGAVQGMAFGGVRMFLGIPYAAAPVGELRWKAPQRPAPWKGPLEATAYCPACPQTGPLAAASSEDCLRLNVWAPELTDGRKLPVMVWIHGGGFTFGSASQPEYDGANLARQGVVVVTLNYRLGPLGFLVHPGLAGESGAAGNVNFGLLDQIAALQWVKRNIAAFGGDPGNVTIFGQSAGSRSVSLLTLSPPARGLFKRAIAQSGGPIIGSEYLTPNFNGDRAQASATGRTLAARLGCGGSPDEMACMRTKPATQVLQAADIKTSIFEEGLFFAPIFDGATLPKDPAAALGPAGKDRVPMILGSTGDEGTTYLRGEAGLGMAKYDAFLKSRFGADAREARVVFPARSDAEVPGAVNRLITVAVNAQPARYVARSLERAGSKAWLYRFTRKPDTARARELGAFHGVELAYVFGNMNDADGYTDADRDLARQVMAYWVNFARTGNPNGPGLLEWPAYSRAKDASLDFGDDVRRETRIYGDACDFIDRTSRFGLAR